MWPDEGIPGVAGTCWKPRAVCSCGGSRPPGDFDTATLERCRQRPPTRGGSAENYLRDGEVGASWFFAGTKLWNVWQVGFGSAARAARGLGNFALPLRSDLPRADAAANTRNKPSPYLPAFFSGNILHCLFCCGCVLRRRRFHPSHPEASQCDFRSLKLLQPL